MPTMLHWRDTIAYSIHHDREMSRVSGFDDHQREHWTMVETGKGYRERRDEAVVKLMESIEAGDEAGELK